MKPRILLHSMTFKRDFGFIYCLAKILEKMGCETFVCSNTDYCSAEMKMWKPHVVFYVTVGRTESISKHHPGSALVLWNAESCYVDTAPPPDTLCYYEISIAADENLYRKVDKILLWSQSTKNMILEGAKQGNWKWILDNLGEFERKFQVVGHPRLDLSKYGIRQNKNPRKVKIGFIGMCATINNNKHPCVELLLDLYDRKVNQVDVKEDLYFEAKYFDMISLLVHKLGCEKYEFNLRTHFLENIQNYRNSSLIQSGRLTLDDSVEFTSWVKEQDVIIGTVSTTMYLVAGSQKPYINVDNLFKRQEGARFFANDYLSAIPKNCPDTYDKLFEMIENYQEYKLIPESGTTLERQLSSNFAGLDNLPVLFRIAQEIILSSRKRTKGGIPTWLCSLIDDLRIRYAEFRSIDGCASDYSHFNRRKTFEKASQEFKYAIEDVLANIPERTMQEFLKGGNE